MKILHVCFVLTVLAATGCAVGNKYDYQSTTLALPVSGSGELGYSVIDNRSYVLNGDKKPDFIGLQRGGFGNPFDVTTASGKPLTQDIASVLGQALLNAGYNPQEISISSADESVMATAVSNAGKFRNVVLIVTEWKTDAMLNLTLHYNLALKVLNAAGNVIASNETQGKEAASGAGFQSQNARSASAALETKVARLFNTPEIKAALGN